MNLNGFVRCLFFLLALAFSPVTGDAIEYLGFIQSEDSGIWYDCWICGEHNSSILLYEGSLWCDRWEMPLGICWEMPCSHLLALTESGTAYPPETPDPEHAATAEPANVINGALLDAATDIVAGNLAYRRHYSSARTDPESRIGTGWTDDFQWRLVNPSAGGMFAELRRPDGSTVSFLWIPSEGLGRSFYAVPWEIRLTNDVYRVDISPGSFLDFDMEGHWIAAHNARTGSETFLSYDTSGRLVSVTNNQGDRLDFSYGYSNRIARIETQRPTLYQTYEYDDTGHLTNATLHASGETFPTVYAYDVGGNNIATITPDGNETLHEFDEQRRAVSITPGDGFFAHTLAYPTNRWVEEGYVEDWPPWNWIDTSHWEAVDHTVVAYQRNDATTNVFDYYFNADKTRVSRMEGPNTSSIQNTFSVNSTGLKTEDLFITYVHPFERVSSLWSYGSRMNLTEVRQTFNDTATTHIEWNCDETLPTAVIDPAGLRMEKNWDESGRLVEIREFPDQTTTNRTGYAYDNYGFLMSITDGDGRETKFYRDATHNPTSVVDAAGVVYDLAWDDLGHLISFTRRGSLSTSWSIDDRGHVCGILYPDGCSETFCYDALGRLSNAVDRIGRVTTFQPAAYGVPEAVSRSGATEEAYYDGVKDLLAVRDPLGRTAETYVRDLRGRVITVTNLENQVETIIYGTESRPVFIRRFDGTEASLRYDSLGRVSQITTPRSRTEFSWLSNGMLCSVSNFTGTISYLHDGRGAVTNTASPAGNVAYRLSTAGIVTNATAGNLSASAILDSGGRATNLVFIVPGLSPLSFCFAYEPGTHRLSSVTNPNGVSATNAYDDLDRPTNTVWSIGPAFAYAYSNDLVSSIMREDGSQTKFEYDALDRLVSETRVIGSYFSHSASYAYDLADNRLVKSIDGVGTAIVVCAYGSGDRLASWSAEIQNPTLSLPIAGESSEPIGMDDRFGELFVRVGDSTEEAPHVAHSRFWTDPQFLSLFAETPVVAAIRDAAGNMVVATNAVQPLAVTNALYAYTEAGCVSNISYFGTGGYSRNLAIEWDDGYRPVSFDCTTHSIVSTSLIETTCSVSYDALGRILSVDENGDIFTRLYDGVMPLADFDATGGLRRVWLAAPGVDKWLGFVDYATSATPTLYTYCTDAQGSVLAVCDAAGEVVERYEYDAWGRVLSIRDGSGAPLIRSGVGNRIYWQGREYFPELGLYHFRARWYDPVTGRFLSKDPIGIASGLNLYAFCGNNPISMIDPMGTSIWSVTKSFAVGAVVGVAVAAVIVVAAPAAVAALVSVGMSATAASASVTTALGVGALIGTASTVVSTYGAVQRRDWDAVSFNMGVITGGLAYGAFRGRSMVNKMTGTESRAPTGTSIPERLEYERANGFRLDYPNGSLLKWMGSAPTPMAGGLAVGASAGSASWYTPVPCGEKCK